MSEQNEDGGMLDVPACPCGGTEGWRMTPGFSAEYQITPEDGLQIWQDLLFFNGDGFECNSCLEEADPDTEDILWDLAWELGQAPHISCGHATAEERAGVHRGQAPRPSLACEGPVAAARTRPRPWQR